MSARTIFTSSPFPLFLAGFRFQPQANLSVLPNKIDLTVGLSLRR